MPRKVKPLASYVEPKTSVKKQRTSVMLPPELHDELTDLTNELNTTYPRVIKALLDFYKENAQTA